MSEGDDELYRRVARLAYLARFDAGDSWAMAHQIADTAVRRASRSKVTQDTAIDHAVASIVKAGVGTSRRLRRRFGPIAPVEPTEAQAGVMRQLTKFGVSARVGALLYFLEDIPVPEAASRVWSYGPATAEARIRDAVEGLQRDLTTKAVRELLSGDGLDPARAALSPADIAAARRRRLRSSAAIGTAAVVAIAAGVWWYVLRTPPLGTFADDPVRDRQPYSTNLSIGRWTPRGELLGDTALLRRAASEWRAEGPAPTGRPVVLFAGVVHGTKVVVLESRFLVAVYTDGSPDTSRVWVNPFGMISFSSGIRLMTGRTESVLLPPGVTSAMAGDMTAQPAGWHPVPVDARGVAEVPGPVLTNDQVAQDESAGTYPADGIRFTLPDTLDKIKENPITLADSFNASAPVLPSVEPDYAATRAGTPLTAADWCLAQRTAEKSRSSAAYSTESMTDTASGPLPDGAGTGTVLEQTLWTAGFGESPSLPGTLTYPRLASTTGGTCTAAPLPAYVDLDDFVMDGFAPFAVGRFNDADAVLWKSPANKTYLVVAASSKASGIRVSGTATGSADGRWLVVPVPDTFDSSFMGLVVRAVDASGHVCGAPITAGTTAPTYC